jgi:glycolate oxidase FAD binding subunit
LLLISELQEAVRAAQGEGAALEIVGGGSKHFYGRAAQGRRLEVAAHRGVIEYEPTELVFTARGATPLAELEALLAEHGQMLGFEPPHFGAAATLGGTLACGLSGPRRPYAGALRDFVLGVTLLTGRGEVLRFGGKVMKNVAGYDLSRLMAGAMGTLGIVLEVSMKVLPLPPDEVTLARHANAEEALRLMNEWAARPLPLSAACFDGDLLYVRLAGATSAVRAAREQLGGEALPDGPGYWEKLREHRHGFFTGDQPLWRLSVPPGQPPLALRGKWLLDWGGAQRWLRTEEPAARIRAVAAEAGGHAMLFRGGDRTGEVFHPLAPAVMALHRNLKAAFDPKGILNPGRMWQE